MTKTAQIGVASVGLSLTLYATGMLLLGSLTTFGYLVMLPLSIGGFCLFINPLVDPISETGNKIKEKFNKEDAQVA